MRATTGPASFCQTLFQTVCHFQTICLEVCVLSWDAAFVYQTVFPFAKYFRLFGKHFLAKQIVGLFAKYFILFGKHFPAKQIVTLFAKYFRLFDKHFPAKQIVGLFAKYFFCLPNTFSVCQTLEVFDRQLNLFAKQTEYLAYKKSLWHTVCCFQIVCQTIYGLLTVWQTVCCFFW
jgi:hypothetical protein